MRALDIALRKKYRQAPEYRSGDFANSRTVLDSAKTEHDLRDLVYFAPSHQSRNRAANPSHIDVSAKVSAHWGTVGRVGSALLGGVSARRRVVTIRGELTAPELRGGFGWRPFRTMGRDV